MPRFLVLYEWGEKQFQWDVADAVDAETACRTCLDSLRGHPRAVAASWRVYPISGILPAEYFESRPASIVLRSVPPPDVV